MQSSGTEQTRWARSVAVAALLAFAPAAHSATFHFSATGNDATGNGSIDRPWRSIDKLNTLSLRPGDSALFKAGDTFNGKIWLDSNDAGTNSQGRLVAPVKIGSYGATGSVTRATVVAPRNNEGFVAYNAGGIELSDLEFVSGGFDANARTNGVNFLSDRSRSASLSKFDHVRVNNVSSRGFGLSGLQVWAHTSVGFNDVQVTSSEFSGNGYTGIYVGATQYQQKYHTNVVVDGVVSHNNPGFNDPSLPYTGHGVILANLDGGVIQNSAAYDNGKVYGNGNIGLWTYQSNGVTIQNNVSYGNRSPGGYDGGGFDIDGGATNTVVQYNHSYDNDGAGMLLAEYQTVNPMGNNIFRYNLSVNDGRDGYGGITVYGVGSNGLAEDTIFHNNTVVVDKSVVPGSKGAVWFYNGNHDDLEFFNNAFVALNGAPLIAGQTSTSKSKFVDNAYWTDGGPIILQDVTRTSVQSWSQSTGQERMDGQFTGVTSDPLFADSEGYRLLPGSPLVDQGRAALAATWFGGLGIRDITGAPLYQGVGPDIGARELLVGDFNSDGAVDSQDFATWKASFGSVGLGLAADGNADGRVDAADFTLWRDQHQFFAATYGTTEAAAAVPEPASAALALLGLALLVGVRRAA